MDVRNLNSDTRGGLRPPAAVDAAGRAAARRTPPAPRARPFLLLLAPLALLWLAPAAAAQTSVYHIRGNASAGSNNIWHVNLTTGVETVVYTGYSGGNAATLAQRPSDGMIFY